MISHASFDNEFLNDAAVPSKPACRLAGNCNRSATLSKSAIAVPRETRGPRLKDTVTAGNCPWCLMESGSVVIDCFVNVLNGIALAPTELFVVFGVVPATVPPANEVVPLSALFPPTTCEGGVNTEGD